MPEVQQSVPPSADDLQRRRREVGRGLRRSYYGVLWASVMISLPAVAPVWLSRMAQDRAADALAAGQRAEISAREAHRASDRLWQIGKRAVALERSSRNLGQRTTTVELIHAAWQPSRELRDEALSALLLPDLGTSLAWHEESGFESASAYALERTTLALPGGVEGA